MPREGPSAGFDPVPVCAFCIENLTSVSFFAFSESVFDRENAISYCWWSDLLEEDLPRKA